MLDHVILTQNTPKMPEMTQILLKSKKWIYKKSKKHELIPFIFKTHTHLHPTHTITLQQRKNTTPKHSSLFSHLAHTYSNKKIKEEESHSFSSLLFIISLSKHQNHNHFLTKHTTSDWAPPKPPYTAPEFLYGRWQQQVIHGGERREEIGNEEMNFDNADLPSSVVIYNAFDTMTIYTPLRPRWSVQQHANNSFFPPSYKTYAPPLF